MQITKDVFRASFVFMAMLFVCLTNDAFADAFATTALPLRGKATYTYWGFTVYNAKVFVPSEVKDIQKDLGIFPIRLELAYTRDLKAKDFIESGAVFMKDNKDVPFQKVASANNQMNALYQDVKDGDRYTLEFIPDQGTTLYYNGIKKGTVQGTDFAKSFLGIWLSKYSLKESFTDELLGID